MSFLYIATSLLGLGLGLCMKAPFPLASKFLLLRGLSCNADNVKGVYRPFKAVFQRLLRIIWSSAATAFTL